MSCTYETCGSVRNVHRLASTYRNTACPNLERYGGQVLEMAGRLHLPLGGLATDLATEHGGIDANKRDAVR